MIKLGLNPDALAVAALPQGLHQGTGVPGEPEPPEPGEPKEPDADTSDVEEAETA